jgi:hypothetical protein
MSGIDCDNLWAPRREIYAAPVVQRDYAVAGGLE